MCVAVSGARTSIKPRDRTVGRMRHPGFASSPVSHPLVRKLGGPPASSPIGSRSRGPRVCLLVPINDRSFSQCAPDTAPLHRDLRRGAFDLLKILPRKLDRNGSNVLFEAMVFRCARYWNNPRLPCKQPRKCDLIRCRLLLLSNLAEQIHQRLIGFQGFRRKARQCAADGLVIGSGLAFRLPHQHRSAVRKISTRDRSPVIGPFYPSASKLVAI